STLTLNNAIGGWSWRPSTTCVSDSSSAVCTVNRVTSGAVTITYTSSAGCIATMALTVNPLPASITGTTNIYAGATTTLSNATGRSEERRVGKESKTVGSSLGRDDRVTAWTIMFSY